MKSAPKKLQEMWSESELTSKIIRDFSERNAAKYGSHSYAEGFLSGMVGDLIMELPKAKREQYRARLLRFTPSDNS